MAYTPTEWQCGDTITAEKLNKMEDGIANAGGGGTPLIFTATEEIEPCEDGSGARAKTTYSHSWQEIFDALSNGTPVYRKTLVVDAGTVTAYLETITRASTDNDQQYEAHIVDGGELVFPNATDKVVYEGECKDK